MKPIQRAGSFINRLLAQEEWVKLMALLAVVSVFQPYYYFLVVLAQSSSAAKEGLLNPVALEELRKFYFWSTPIYVLLIPTVYVFRHRRVMSEILSALSISIFFALTVWSIHYIGLNSTSLTVILSAALVAQPVLFPGWKSVAALVTTLVVFIGVSLAEYWGMIPMAPVLYGYIPPFFKTPVALFIYIGIVLALNTTAFLLSYWMVGIARRRQMERDRAYEALRLEKVRVDQELAEARQIQARLFPQMVPSLAGVRLAGTCVVSLEVGGDYYDYFSPSPSELALIVADVTGKGVPAAMVMSMVKIAIHSRRDLLSHPARLVRQINHLLCTTGHRLPVTLFYGVLESRTGLFRYSNAGHPYPYVLPANKGPLVPLELDAFPLGIEPGTGYAERQIRLRPADTLVMYSDGIVEAKNTRGKLFGFERLENFLRMQRDRTPEGLSKAILKVVRSHSATWPPADDATLLIARLSTQARRRQTRVSA